MKKILLLTALFAVASCGESGQRSELRLAHTLPSAHPINDAYLRFAELVNEKSDGKYNIIVYSDSQLGDQRAAIQLAQSGGLEFVHMNVATLENFDDTFTLLNLPFIFTDYDHYTRVMTDPKIREMYALLEPKGFIPLTYLEGGARSMYIKDKAIKTPADMTGLKVRVQESPAHIEMIQRLGGSPVAMAPSEIYTALQQGVIDGAENNSPTYYSQRHSEVAKDYSMTEHMRLSDILSTGSPFWAGLSDEDKAMFQEAAAIMSAEFADVWAAGEAKADQDLQGDNVVVHQVNNPEEFRALVLPMHEAFAQRGPEHRKWLEFVYSLTN